MRDLPPPYVTNERIKSFSRTLFQLGTALFGGDVVKFYSLGAVSGEIIAWMLVSIALMWSGWLVLGLLESEK